MHYADFSRGYILNITQDEMFHSTLVAFFEQKRLPSAFFQGIGALKNIELAYFNVKTGLYQKKRFPQIYELTSAMGNISLIEGRPFIHTHVTLGDENFKTISGHLVEAEVAVVVELFFMPIDIALLRQKHPEHDFHMLDLPHYFS